MAKQKRKGWVHPKATKIFVLLRWKKKKLHSQRHFTPCWAPCSSMTNLTITRTNSHQWPLIAKGLKVWGATNVEPHCFRILLQNSYCSNCSNNPSMSSPHLGSRILNKDKFTGKVFPYQKKNNKQCSGGKKWQNGQLA